MRLISSLLRQRPNLVVALLLLIISVMLFLPYLLQPEMLMWPRSELGTDMLTYNWPSIYFFRETLREYGQMPLWQGTSMGGLPLIANPAVRVFYPPQLLISLLPVPILWGYALLNVVHFWLAGIGAYGLARSVLKVDYPAAFLAAVLIMLTPRLSSNVVGDVGYTHGLCWLPLCLLWTRLAFDQRSWRWAIAAGAAVCCIYLNNIQYILYAGWLIGLYFVYRCAVILIERRGARALLEQVGIVMVIFAVCVGLSAFQSFTFASYLPDQSREAMTLADSNYLALPVFALVNLIFPMAQKFPEWEIYVGLLPLIFAPLAFLHPARRETLLWVGLFIFAVLFSLGAATPLYTLMFYGVPGFSFLRVPARMWYVAAIALVMLTALAVDVLMRPDTHLARRWWRLLAVSELFILTITIAGRFLTRRPDELDWMLGFLASGGVILALVSLRWWQHQRLSKAAFTLILFTAVMLDLFPLDVAFGRPRPLAEFLTLPPIAQTMIDHAGENDLYRVYNVRREILDHVAVAHGLETAEGLNSFQFTDYAGFMRIASGCPLDRLAAAVPACASNEISPTAYLDSHPDPVLLGLLNVRYIITPFELPPDEHLTLVAEVGDERLYENAASLPRSFIQGQDTPATITHYSPNEIRIEVQMPEAGTLVLGDPWVSGWTAAVDGRDAPVLRVNGALRGVDLDAGSHVVTFSFQPTAFVIGLVVTVITGLVCMLALVIGHLRRL